MWLLKPLLVVYHLSLLFSTVFAQDTNVADEPRQKISYQVSQVDWNFHGTFASSFFSQSDVARLRKIVINR